MRARNEGPGTLACARTRRQGAPVATIAQSRSGVPYHSAPGRFSRGRWLAFVTLGEALGFLAPGLAWFAAWTLDLPALASAGVVVSAGAIEGAVLGFSQWRVARMAAGHEPDLGLDDGGRGGGRLGLRHGAQHHV